MLIPDAPVFVVEAVGNGDPVGDTSGDSTGTGDGGVGAGLGLDFLGVSD